MLLNFSNHPYEKWGEKQYQAALQQFDKVADMPFPNVAPDLSGGEVQALAAAQLQLIQQQYRVEIAERKFALLLSGEQSFIIFFYIQAQVLGLPCYVATSERNTVLNENGSKTVVFNFVQFRKV